MEQNISELCSLPAIGKNMGGDAGYVGIKTYGSGRVIEANTNATYTMHCPYCHGELISGYLYHEINHRPTWLPASVKPFLGFSTVNGDPIGKFWSGKIFCYRCDECMKIVIDIEDEKNL